MSKAAHQRVAAWVFATACLTFLIASYFATQDDSATHPIVRFVGALCAGLFGYFFTGSVSFVAEGQLPRIGRAAIKSGGGAAVLLVVFVAWPGSSTFTVQVLLHQGDRSDLVAVSGTLRLPIGNTLPSATVEPPGRALFQGLSANWRGMTVSCTLDSREYKLVPPAQVVLDDSSPTYLEVKRRHFFARPDQAAVRADLVSASAVVAASYPDQLWLNIQLRVVSLSEQAVPLGSSATFSVLSPQGLTMRSTEVELASGLSSRGVVLQPGEVVSVFLDDSVPREFFAMHGSSQMWEVVLKYDSLVEQSDVSFTLGPFDFDSSSILFERN